MNEAQKNKFLQACLSRLAYYNITAKDLIEFENSQKPKEFQKDTKAKKSK